MKKFRSPTPPKSEGMEGGSKNPFHNSEADITALVPRVFRSYWEPAQRFWDCFELYDFIEVRPGIYRTEACFAELRKRAGELLEATPENVWQLQEKLKICATISATIQLLRPKPATRETELAWMTCIHTLTNVSHRCFHVQWAADPVECRVFANIIAIAPRIWRERLKLDYERLEHVLWAFTPMTEAEMERELQRFPRPQGAPQR